MYNKKRIILTLAVAVTAATCGWSRGYMDYVEDADKAVAEERWDDAIDALESAMRLDPSNDMNVLLLSNTGMLHFYAGRDSVALTRLDAAHIIAPRSVTILCNRARVLTATGFVSDALADYDAATAIDSTAVEPYYYRGMIRMSAGEAEAVSDFETLKQIAPDNNLTHEAWSLYDLQTGEYADALPHLDALIKASATAQLYGERAVCRLKTGDFGGASDDISLGLELDDQCSTLYVARALYKRLSYLNEESMDDVKRAIDAGASQQWIKEVIGL